jgi:FKBP-type peptidyl-prolyl cis-trans isomerase SlyD
MSRLWTVSIAALLLLAAPGVVLAQDKDKPAEPAPAAAPAAPAIQSGATVQLEYTLTDDGGAVIGSNRGRVPLRYTHGQNEIPVGLERALAGLHAGDHKSVTLPPEEAFGAVDPKATAEVPKDSLPSDALVVGTPLIAQAPDGGERPVRVKEIREQSVVLDLNHPLAGRTLHFDIHVLDVSSP